MKIELSEVSETRKHLTFEVPPDVVEAEIDKVARGYARSARVPGFRPGKVPAGVLRQRFREQILQDVANELIPRLVGTELRERNLNPVAMPDIKDVVLEEGKPLTFVADFETMPAISVGEYAGLSLRKPPAVLEVGAVDRALEQLQQRAARWQPIEDRPATTGDTVLADLTRTRRGRLVQLARVKRRRPTICRASPNTCRMCRLRSATAPTRRSSTNIWTAPLWVGRASSP
jgi:trigger factor